MDECRIYDFMACVVESTGNAAKHAKRGSASLHQRNGSLIFVVRDHGPGISTMSIPDVALTRGYTTAGTLGMGYKVMINFADRVYLATDPGGTTVALEMALHADARVSAPVGIPFN
jgi:anti-sigma regulatory factor (Ser/Thr protein kinase)